MQSQADIDDGLIARFLGSKYLGRRYLRYAELEALGLIDNRGSLQNWMDVGAFPRGIKIPGPYGKVLVWLVVEIAQLIAQRVAERDASQRASLSRDARPFLTTVRSQRTAKLSNGHVYTCPRQLKASDRPNQNGRSHPL